MTAPNKATVFTFNVGFGDCFLLRFSYPNGDNRHVLIDFGSTRAPAGAGKNHMKLIAAEIKRLCGKSLDVVVATHRHKDHISGFATSSKKDGPGDVIAELKPKLVVQPWTERPDIPEDAKGPQAGSHAFAKTLNHMSDFAEALHQFAASLTSSQLRSLGMSNDERDFLGFIGENNVANKSAVKNLMKMGEQGKALYLHADDTLDVSDILPGVAITVLGPPTVEQHGEVAIQKATNQAEYWHLLKMDSAAMTPASSKGAPLFPKYEKDEIEPYARWTARRVMRLRKDMLLPIVTALDDAMNNTSLVLLFQIGRKSLLFPGDAQWENWQYALSKPRYEKLLRNVDLYKVGHHGSLNATPKSLWALFDRKGDTKKRGRLTSLMSTLHGVHGHSPETAVPRSTLVDDLKLHSHHHSTEDLPSDKLFEEIPIEL